MNSFADFLLPFAVIGMLGLIVINVILNIRIRKMDDRKLISDIEPANFVRMRQELLDAVDNRLKKFEKLLAEARTLRDELGILRETIQTTRRNQVTQPEMHPSSVPTTPPRKVASNYERTQPERFIQNQPKDEVIIQSSQPTPAARVVVVQQPSSPQPNAGRLNAPFSMQSTQSLANPVHRAIAKEIAAGTLPEVISSKLNVSAGEVELVAKIINQK